MTRYLLLVMTTAGFLSFAGAVNADSIDDFVKLEMQEQRVPGLSVAILKDGKALKVEGYGLATVEHNVIRYCTFYLDAENKVASFEVTAI